MINEAAQVSPYRWYLLALVALTSACTVAMPTICMSVLFKEISGDLKLDLVQVGFVWGIVFLPSLITNLIGGALGDRFGPKYMLVAACLLVGVMGALRGFASGFGTLAAGSLLFGTVTPLVMTSLFKICGQWFSRRQLGLANGVLSMGMALGYMLGSEISATYLSPLLGGWRNVLFLYGAIAIAIAIPWFFTRLLPGSDGGHGNKPGVKSIAMWKAFSDVAHVKQAWLLGAILFGISGCIQGTLGYLPLYLRGLGWVPANADAAAATFHATSMILVIPIALWSDKVGSRKKVLLIVAPLIVAGIGLLAIVDGIGVWGAVSLAGMVRDGFMGVFMTFIIETEGIGPRYAGTATGFVMGWSGMGNLIAPPVGNSLASIGASLPFVFWSSLAFLGFLGLWISREHQSIGEHVHI
jgi:hypothetical protein